LKEEDIMLEELQKIFREVFDDATLVITPETSAIDIEAWDSLSHLNLVMAMEKEFDIQFDFEELNALRNVGEMMTLIQKKRNSAMEV
jgi:hypothetical protein